MRRKNENAEEENSLLDLIQNGYHPVPPPPIPPYPQRQSQPVFYLLLGGKGNFREGLTKFALIAREARSRFKDPSLDGLIKAALMREVLSEMKLNPSARYPHLEAQIAQHVETGRYFQNYQTTVKQPRNARTYPKASVFLKEIGWMKKHLPKEQHSLYLKTGFYTKGGKVYAWRGAKPVANLAQYVKK